MATVTSLYICIIYISIHISITLIPYHLIFLLHINLFLLHVLCLWHLLYLYFFCIPISSTLHIPILILCSSFTLVICLFEYFAFYVLFIYFTNIYMFLFYHILCAFVFFLCFSCVGLKPILSYYISIFVLHEFLSHRSYLP